MEGSSTVVRQTAIQIDEALRSVMPASWEGHARLAIKKSDDVPASIEEKAIGRALALAEENGVTPKKAAHSLVEAMAEAQE